MLRLGDEIFRFSSLIMEGKIDFSASAMHEYAEVLQKFSVGDSEGVVFFVVNNGAKIY